MFQFGRELKVVGCHHEVEFARSNRTLTLRSARQKGYRVQVETNLLKMVAVAIAMMIAFLLAMDCVYIFLAIMKWCC